MSVGQLLESPAERLPRPRPRRSLSRETLLRLAALPAAVVLVLIAWEAIVVFGDVNEVIVPRPTSILRALVSGFSAPISSRASYFPHLQQTLLEIIAGYVVGSTAGVVLAMISVRFALIEFLARPFVVAFQSVPKLALAPLLIVWFGFGFNSKFVLVILATFFPLFVNGIVGFKSVEEGPRRLMRSFGASGWQMFTKVTFPTSLPFIFAGLEVAMVHAITSAVAAEFLGGQMGLGVMIMQMEQLLDTPAIFAILILLALVGWLLSVALGAVRRKVVHWAPIDHGPDQ